MSNMWRCNDVNPDVQRAGVVSVTRISRVQQIKLLNPKINNAYSRKNLSPYCDPLKSQRPLPIYGFCIFCKCSATSFLLRQECAQRNYTKNENLKISKIAETRVFESIRTPKKKMTRIDKKIRFVEQHSCLNKF